MALFAALALAGCTDSDEGPGAASRVYVDAPDAPITLSSDAQITSGAQSLAVECVKNSGNPDFKLT